MKCQLLKDQDLTKCSEILIYSRDTRTTREVFVISDLGEVLIIKWEPKEVCLGNLLDLSQSEINFNVNELSELKSFQNIGPQLTIGKNLKQRGTISISVQKVSVNGHRHTNLKLNDQKAMNNFVKLLYGKDIRFRFKGEFLLGISIIEEVASLLVGKKMLFMNNKRII